MDWRDKSACLTVDPELFFPVGNTGPAVDQIEKAKFENTKFEKVCVEIFLRKY